MLLTKLLSALPEAEIIGSAERDAERVVSDSRLANEKTVFADLSGSERSGTAHCIDAAAHGCRIFLRPKNRGKEGIIKEQTLILSENTVKTVAKASYLLAGEPQKKIRLLGVTGTKGKSTVCETVRHLLSANGIPALSVGTLGVGGVDYPALRNTTPDAPVLAEVFKRAAEKGIGYGVIEVSSQSLAVGRVFGLSFPVAVFTSFSPDHIGSFEHENITAYFSAKRSLFRDYGCRVSIVNADDPNWREMTSGVAKILLCGKAKNADFRLDTLLPDGFLMNGKRIRFPYPGEYFATDAMLALAGASVLTGVPAGELTDALSSVSIPGRYEIHRIRGKRCVIDFAHNGASFDAILTEERKHSPGKIVCVFGSVGGRSESRRSDLARSACRFADYSVITSDDPDFEDPLGICAEIYSAFPDKTKARVVVDREKAIRYAYSLLGERDTLLLLGKGHEKTQKIRGVFYPFSERNILCSLDTVSPL